MLAFVLFSIHTVRSQEIIEVQKNWAHETNVGNWELFEQTQWYNCPNGHILAGFYRSNCQRIKCLEEMRCVAPEGPPGTDCLELDIDKEFNGEATVQCPAGYFVNGINNKAGPLAQDLDSFNTLRCCRYDQNVYRAGSQVMTHDWESCFDKGNEEAWCVVDKDEYIIGFSRTTALFFGDQVHHLQSAKTRKLYRLERAPTPLPTPAQNGGVPAQNGGGGNHNPDGNPNDESEEKESGGFLEDGGGIAMILIGVAALCLCCVIAGLLFKLMNKDRKMLEEYADEENQKEITSREGRKSKARKNDRETYHVPMKKKKKKKKGGKTPGARRETETPGKKKKKKTPRVGICADCGEKARGKYLKNEQAFYCWDCFESYY